MCRMERKNRESRIMGFVLFRELCRLSGDKGGKQIICAHKEDVVLCETEEAELRDVDVPEQLIKWERDYGESGKSREET
ncbi:MAG: hypothetical protein ACLR2O_06505 [Coprococcus sp.]